jgi:hypothetical protein
VLTDRSPAPLCAWTGRTNPHTLPINHRPDRVLTRRRRTVGS